MPDERNASSGGKWAGYRARTQYPGIYSRVSKRGETVYDIKFVTAEGQATTRTVHGTLDDAARTQTEILRAIRPTAGGYAAPQFYESTDIDWIVQANSPEPCIYVAQRKINPVIVKIGYSTFRGVRNRMKQERLHLLLAFPGGAELEQEIHEKFGAYRCDVDGAEFFFLTREIRRWIERIREEILGTDMDNSRSDQGRGGDLVASVQALFGWARLGSNQPHTPSTLHDFGTESPTLQALGTSVLSASGLTVEPGSGSDVAKGWSGVGAVA